MTNPLLKEGTDYPSCTLDTAANIWSCAMFLPARANQIDGNPAFDFPGVVNGYFISSFTPIPGDDAMS